MKSVSVIITAACVAALVAYAVGAMHQPSVPAAMTSTASAYDQVMKTKTLRCGYTIWPPYLEKDPNSGAMSGLLVDYMQELGRAFNLKIDWTAEVVMTDIPAALESNRIDAFCATIAAIPARAVNMNFSKPVFYFPFYAYVRQADTRFDTGTDQINNPAITLSTMEGEFTSILARTSFPKAKLLEITGIQGLTTLFLNVADKKADVVFQEPGAFSDYNRKNPNVLRKTSTHPVGVVPGAFPVKLGDTKMQRLMDYGIDDLQNRMITQRLLHQYHVIGQSGTDDLLYLPSHAYQQAP